MVRREGIMMEGGVRRWGVGRAEVIGMERRVVMREWVRLEG